ncbi:unnamed protein product, partial [Angiostrongylus costaricensis]|uniref:tRNA_int_endo_N domain-containing protein n=1 Tax=Angiostrongylus costaricensis TaxID=334426 RepID=A0A0R3PTZ7_ANGCS
NLLDFPAGVVPVGKVTVKDDEDLVNESTYPVGHNVALRIIRDSSINSVGLPLSVQIVTLPFEEEKCLRVMRDVQGVWSDDYLSKEGTLLFAAVYVCSIGMNLIKHEKKLGGGDIGGQFPFHLSRAIIYGGSIIVEDERGSAHIYSHGGYGYYIDEREDRTNAELFPSVSTEGSSVESASIEARQQWSEKLPVYDRLRLSPEETVYLSIDVNVLEVFEKQKILTQKELWLRMKDFGGTRFLKRYVAYRYLRRSGWHSELLETAGILGIQAYFSHVVILNFLNYFPVIYRGSPGSHHAAAGVKIESHMEPCMFVGLNRVLTNMKKALIVLTVVVPDELDETNPFCADSVHISMSTSMTMFADRKMNDIKARESAKLTFDIPKEH